MDSSVSRRLFWSVTILSFGLIIGLGAVLTNVLLTQGGDQRPAAIVERIQLGRAADVAVPSTAAGTVSDAETLSALFKQAAGRVKGAVVYVQVDLGESAVGIWERRFFNDLPRQSVGSGVVISDAGYIVTNSHVVQGASRISVTLSDKRQFDATVIGTDPSTDLAVIRIEEAQNIQVIPFGDSDQVEVGQWVLAIGNPFRLTSTVTAGIVSALGRQVNVIGDSFGIEDFIQTDAAINPGNSGGALVDLNGYLVGINTAIATESGTYEGYGFAVPVNLVSRVAADLIAYGEVRRAYLGVQIRRVDARLAERLGLDEIGGVYLDEVWGGGAADQAGLRIGDVVTSVEGNPVNAPNELQSMIARQRPGDRIDIEAWRRGVTQRFEVVLMGREDPAAETWFADLARPEEAAAPEDDIHAPGVDIIHLDELGIGVREPSRRDLRRFATDGGVYIAYVEKGGLADVAGVPRDGLLRAIDSHEVATVEDLIDAIALASVEEGPALLEVVRRDGISAFYEVRFSDMP